jgi:hypothetical protein
MNDYAGPGELSDRGPTMAEIESCIVEAVELMEHFVTEVTGAKPTREELAKSLKRYFILNEIKDQIVWQRGNPDL